MNPDHEHWEQLQSLFHLAADTPSADLDALLQLACSDPELRTQARRLILAAREPAQQDAGSDTSASEPLLSAAPLRRIGPYTIVRLLGSGGIGTVYLGERVVGGAVQRVAVKVLSPGAAGPAFTDRFAREQHILASLNHAHITRMLDAGMTTTGEPYLVMEYVDGEHLDTWCDSKQLGIAERLRLFVQVCEPVAYAHRNLVVHLDLKPSNVLIAREDGAVKLLDFGTSKLIQPDSLLTNTVMATPAYASPEQLLNEPVTTVCDIYALGAVLFELLSGTRPNHNSSVALLIERSMRELPPERLNEAATAHAAERRALTQTRLQAALSGDLETIVTKCLAPRPRDRYATVDALIEDVERYLAGRPILARPQTTTYRLSKFVRRNRITVLATTFAFLALAGTAGYAAWRQQQAVREGERALQMQSFMYRLFRIANTYYTGKPTATVGDFLQLGVRVLPQFVSNPKDLRAAQLSLAESMYDNSDYKGAQAVLRQVVTSAKAAGDLPAEAEAEAYAGDIEYTIGTAEAGYALTSHALSLANKPGVSPTIRVRVKIFFAQNREETSYRSEDNLTMMRSAIAEAQKEHLPAREIAFATGSLADSLEERGKLNEAASLYTQMLKMYEGDPYATCDEADIHKKLGVIQNQRKDIAGSLQLYQRAYEESSRCAGPEDLQTLSSQGYVASAMIKLGQTKPAIAMLEQSLPAWTKVVGADGSHMATPLFFLSRAYLQDGQFTKAEQTILQVMHFHAKQKAMSSVVGTDYLILARALVGEGRDREALTNVRHAEAAFAAENSKLPAFIDQANEAHRIELELMQKLQVR